MKYAILALALIVALAAAEHQSIHTDEERATMKKHTKACRESTGADHDKILQMRQGHFEEDQHIKDYLFCFFKKMGWQHSDGTMDKDAMHHHLEKSQVATHAMNQCIDLHGHNGPETAFIVHKCYRQHLPADQQINL